jgi:hypothetical protein
MNKGNIIAIACLTGFIGDAILQLGVYNSVGDWGLKSYFKQHGLAESLFIAGGMMTLFYIVYIYVLQLPLKWYYLAIYGIILDYIFRKTMVFKSLEGYYAHLNYFWSAFWGAIPMLIPFVIINI